MDLPLPLSPTSAMVCPGATFKLKSVNTGASGRDGYAKATLRSSTEPCTACSAGATAPAMHASNIVFTGVDKRRASNHMEPFR